MGLAERQAAAGLKFAAREHKEAHQAHARRMRRARKTGRFPLLAGSAPESGKAGELPAYFAVSMETRMTKGSNTGADAREDWIRGRGCFFARAQIDPPAIG
jgi:hypothetical protein